MEKSEIQLYKTDPGSWFLKRALDKAPLTLFEKMTYVEYHSRLSFRDKNSADSFKQRIMREEGPLELEFNVPNGVKFAKMPAALSNVGVEAIGFNLLQGTKRQGFLYAVTEEHVWVRFPFLTTNGNTLSLADKRYRGRTHYFLQFDVTYGENVGDGAFGLKVDLELLGKIKAIGLKLNPGMVYKETE